MKAQLLVTFDELIDVDNLLEAWREFLCGKRGRKDVQDFQLNFMDNVLELHSELANFTYTHGGYQAFNISDPKPRNIHKAQVRDRLLHHAIYRKLYPFFDKTFITDSFSCRDDKGTHKAGERFRHFFLQVSQNNQRTCWVLKCDIRKFFANIDHNVLLQVLRSYIPDRRILWLLGRVVESFNAKPGIGLPLGNLTSQLLVNVYMNEFDQFVKHRLRVKCYIRYADDFVFLSESEEWLKQQIPSIQQFLGDILHLELHPKKLSISTIASGVDFLGWVYFPNHQVLRTTTKRRMFKKLEATDSERVISSYLGLLSHGNGYKLQERLLK